MSNEAPSLFSDFMQLQSEHAGLKLWQERQLEREILYQNEIAWLTEKLLKARRERFGAMKERWESEEQVILFNEAEVEAGKPDPEGETEAPDSEVAVSGFKRKRGKRGPLPTALPREIVTVELPESERFTEDGQPLKVIGKEVSEKLFFEPAKLKVLEYHRLRYGVDSGDPIKTAPPVPSIIPKGIVTPSLLADIVTNKYADGLPLYRQEEIWERTGVPLSRGSMGRWIVQAALACIPVWNVLEGLLLEESYVSCDETHTQVLKEKGRKAETKSWMWVRGTPNRKQPIVLFDYDPHRSGEVAQKLFADYRGFLQADAYSAYNCLEKQDGVIRLGCNMHGRRGFSDADKGAKEGRGLAAIALKYYQRLYDIEEKAKKQGLSPPERKLLRDAEQVPIWEEMKAWADKTIRSVPKKSLIGKALGYWTSQYDMLRGYLVDGRLEMDNGFAERTIRKFAIGRNNWMFSDTPEGAHASALFYSFVVTAKLNGVNPYQALRTIFERIPTASCVEDYEALAKLLLSPAAAA
jgi:transposase